MSSSPSKLRTLAFVALTGWSANAAAAPAPYRPTAHRHPAAIPAGRTPSRFGAIQGTPSTTPHHATASKPNRATGIQTVPGMRPDQITHH
jgi:hypothetical protein